MHDALTLLLILAAVALGVMGVRGMRRALHRAHSLDLIRGIRFVVFGAVALLAAAGVATGKTGFFVLAAVFLGEEIYETTLVAAIIRACDSAERLPASEPAPRASD
jgi:hypothetical protein